LEREDATGVGEKEEDKSSLLFKGVIPATALFEQLRFSRNLGGGDLGKGEGNHKFAPEQGMIFVIVGARESRTNKTENAEGRKTPVLHHRRGGKGLRKKNLPSASA